MWHFTAGCQTVCNHTEGAKTKTKIKTQDGFEFSLALNGVLLCQGPLPAAYMRRIERESLLADWR